MVCVILIRGYCYKRYKIGYYEAVNYEAVNYEIVNYEIADRKLELARHQRLSAQGLDLPD
jgi:hypothetical protein